MSELLLFLLHSRKTPNISQAALSQVEESQDYSDFSGFFKDFKAKDLFVILYYIIIIIFIIQDIIMKHLISCIKKKIAGKKDVEIVFTRALINF